MAGRKSKYTPELVAEINNLLAEGVTVKDTCAAVGITQETFFAWCKSKPEFSESTTRARAQARILAVRVLQKAIQDGNTYDAKWFLERSDHEHWGPQTTIKIEGNLSLDLINETIRALHGTGADPEQVLRQLIEAAKERARSSISTDSP